MWDELSEGSCGGGIKKKIGRGWREEERVDREGNGLDLGLKGGREN